jgi:hypothetical protein
VNICAHDARTAIECHNQVKISPISAEDYRIYFPVSRRIAQSRVFQQPRLIATVNFQTNVIGGYGFTSDSSSEIYCFGFALSGARSFPRLKVIVEKSRVKLSKFATTSCPRFP